MCRPWRHVTSGSSNVDYAVSQTSMNAKNTEDLSTITRPAYCYRILSRPIGSPPTSRSRLIDHEITYRTGL